MRGRRGPGAAQTLSPRRARPRHDLPLLVKASAGGGGRGMRIVTDLAELAGAVEAAGAEAESAFGDGTVFVEPYVERSRHVEVQVVGDRSGDVLVLGERDCSLQRRHQKVVEESPAPDLAVEVAGAMHDAARAAAAAIGYVGAGTVEFLYDPQRERLLLPGDEHPAAGRAPGHRAGARRRPGRAPAGAWPRARVESPTTPVWSPRGTRTSSPGAGTRSRPGCTPRTPPPTTTPVRSAHHLRDPPRGGDPGRRRLRVGQRGVDPLRRDAGQGDLPRPHPRRRPPAPWRAPWPGPGSTGSPPTATSWSRSCATAEFLAGRVHTGFLDGRTAGVSVGPRLGAAGSRGCHGRR